jgi:hypothetical protein
LDFKSSQLFVASPREKGVGAEIIREMRKVIEDEGLSNYESIYTDGSLKEEKVGCAVLKYQLLPQTTIVNAEMFAILKATEHSKHMHHKTVIMTDSLSSLTALERVYPGRNSTIPKKTQPVSRGRGGLETNAHTGIERNESADKAAEEALEIRATENDWFKWMKAAAMKRERNE